MISTTDQKELGLTIVREPFTELNDDDGERAEWHFIGDTSESSDFIVGGELDAFTVDVNIVISDFVVKLVGECPRLLLVEGRSDRVPNDWGVEVVEMAHTLRDPNWIYTASRRGSTATAGSSPS
jgi:hypothetical protein